MLQCFGNTCPSATFENASLTLEWLLHKLKEDINHNIFEYYGVRWFLGHLIYQGRLEEMEQFFDAASSTLPSRNIEAELSGLRSYTLNLNYTRRPSLKSRATLEYLKDRGLDFHHVDDGETPTSAAMRTSLSFFRWLEDLVALKFDLEDSVKQELTTAPLWDDGWDEDTLLFLFLCDFQPWCQVYRFCDRHYTHWWPRENWWRRTLQEIKARRYPY